jgi:hypothetical protein
MMSAQVESTEWAVAGSPRDAKARNRDRHQGQADKHMFAVRLSTVDAPPR